MTKKGWLFGALLTMSLAVAAADPPRPAPTPAKEGSDADWKLLIRNASPLRPFRAATCTAGPGGSCVINIVMPAKCDTNVKPNPEVLKIGPQVTIIWKLSGGGWSFDPSTGITFTDPSAPFDSRNLGPQVWQAKVRESPRPGFYQYKVNLRLRDGSTCQLDPGVWV